MNSRYGGGGGEFSTFIHAYFLQNKLGNASVQYHLWSNLWLKLSQVPCLLTFAFTSFVSALYFSQQQDGIFFAGCLLLYHMLMNNQGKNSLNNRLLHMETFLFSGLYSFYRYVSPLQFMIVPISSQEILNQYGLTLKVQGSLKLLQSSIKVAKHCSFNLQSWQHFQLIASHCTAPKCFIEERSPSERLDRREGSNLIVHLGHMG